MTNDKKIEVGKIISAHGIKGCVKVRSFTSNPLSILDYAPIVSEGGDVFTFKLQSPAVGDVLIVKINDVDNRTDAEGFRGIRLFTNRSNIAKNDDDVLMDDLIGLDVMDKNNVKIGVVAGVPNYGAGAVLDITLNSNKSALMSINPNSVINTDLKKGLIKIDQEHLIES